MPGFPSSSPSTFLLIFYIFFPFLFLSVLSFWLPLLPLPCFLYNGRGKVGLCVFLRLHFVSERSAGYGKGSGWEEGKWVWKFRVRRGRKRKVGDRGKRRGTGQRVKEGRLMRDVIDSDGARNGYVLWLDCLRHVLQPLLSSRCPCLSFSLHLFIFYSHFRLLLPLIILFLLIPPSQFFFSPWYMFFIILSSFSVSVFSILDSFHNFLHPGRRSHDFSRTCSPKCGWWRTLERQTMSYSI